MTIEQKSNNDIVQIKFRILELSFKHRISHIGSCLTAAPIIYECYANRPEKHRFVLSAGHAGLALYVVLEHFKIIPDAELLLTRDGIHPVRIGNEAYIHCSTGSLGLGATIAVGIAASLPDHRVDCMCSDGEASEGAIYEALNYSRNAGLNNLHFHFNLNGFSALDKTDTVRMTKVLTTIHDGIKIHHTEGKLREFPFLNGLDAHYYVMNNNNWATVCEWKTKFDFINEK
ncbi:MAG TPA: hypothetical protein DCQ93_04005 [Bacteroidetes bacterium]|nr:hypothetical protein [Bacteroidota bacterium]